METSKASTWPGSTGSFKCDQVLMVIIWCRGSMGESPGYFVFLIRLVCNHPPPWAAYICGLRMRRECRERAPRHRNRLLATPACIGFCLLYSNSSEVCSHGPNWQYVNTEQHLIANTQTELKSHPHPTPWLHYCAMHDTCKSRILNHSPWLYSFVVALHNPLSPSCMLLKSVHTHSGRSRGASKVKRLLIIELLRHELYVQNVVYSRL